MARPTRAVRRSTNVAALALSAALLAAAPAAAQRYETIRPQLTAPQAQLLQAKVTGALRNPAIDAAGLKDVDDYFKKYYFPMMTSTDPRQLGLLVENRERLFRQYINLPRVAPAAQKHLVDLTANAMRVIAKGNYHPAVRYNAVLVLGQLDQEAGVTGAAGKPPVPLAAATGELVGLLENEQFNNVPVIPAVQIGALVGLERHARFGVDPQYADRITQAALAIIDRPEPPEGVTDAVYDWMRVQAARVLVSQFAKGGLKPAAYQALVKLIGTKQMELDDRCEVAEALVPTLFENAQGLDLDAMILALGQLAREVTAAESKSAEEYQDQVLREGGGFGGFGGEGGGRFGGYGGRGFGGEGRGGGGFDPNMIMQPQGPQLERRRLLDRLMAVVTGGNAVRPAASPEGQQRLTALVKPLKDVADQAAGKATDAAVADFVVMLADEVREVVNGWAAPADDAAAESDDEAAAADDAAAFGN